MSQHSYNQRHGLLRQVANTLLFCLAVAIAPQALAQTGCGAAIPLVANQWRMVGIPCNPGANNTIVGVFGPSFGPDSYGVTWIAWKRNYSAGGDAYVKLAATDTVAAGTALWLYSTVAVNLRVGSGTSSATSGTAFDFTGYPSQGGASRYVMLADPFNVAVNWSSLRFRGLLFDIFNVDWSTQTASNLSIVSPNVYYWNGMNTYFTRNLGDPPPAATFTPHSAAWIEMQGNSALFSNLVVRVPKP